MTIKEYETKYNRESGNNFAVACYDQNTKQELMESLDAPDQGDMDSWDLSEDEWRDAIRAALEEMAEDDMACGRGRALV